MKYILRATLKFKRKEGVQMQLNKYLKKLVIQKKKKQYRESLKNYEEPKETVT